MRPASIILFERLFFLNLLLGVIGFYLNYESVMQQLAADPAVAKLNIGRALLIGTYAIGVTANILLWFFIARKANNVARWLFAAIMGLGLLFNAPGLLSLDLSFMTAFTLVGFAITVALIVLLFRKDAQAWFSDDTTTDPQVFD